MKMKFIKPGKSLFHNPGITIIERWLYALHDPLFLVAWVVFFVLTYTAFFK